MTMAKCGHLRSDFITDINIQVISSDSSKVCGTSSSAARTADTSDECATFRLYGSRKVRHMELFMTLEVTKWDHFRAHWDSDSYGGTSVVKTAIALFV